ncbi:MAG: hypothetical protein ACQESN_02730 [Thermotogota bacterium]
MNLNLVKRNIKELGRDLEYYRYLYFYENGKSIDIINELEKYQNEDGGFGNALEPDIRMPHSSATATSVAFQIMKEINYKNCDNIVKSTIKYLENTFDYDNKRWYAANEKVNDFPRAPWWDFLEDEKMTVIDYSFGNPTAELVGFLLDHKDKIKKIDIEKQKDLLIEKLIEKDNANSEHEIYSYLRLYNSLNEKDKKKIYLPLYEAINSLVVYDESKWKEYVPQPVHFLQVVEDNEYFGIKKEELLKNLEYISEQIRKYGYLKINFEWGRMKKDFEIAKNEWVGIFTLQALKALDKFNYL